MASQRGLKKEVKRLLSSAGWKDHLAGLKKYSLQNLAGALISCLSSHIPEIKFRAVEALGEIASAQPLEGLEAIRDLVRRLTWSLNEESGSIIWGAPEALAEIMARQPVLADEYLNIFLSYLDEGANQLDFIPLQRGVLWGLGRLAGPQRDLIRSRGGEKLLPRALVSPDAETRGLAAWTLGRLGEAQDVVRLTNLKGDNSQILLWEKEMFLKTTVGDLAEQAIRKIGSSPLSA